MRADRLISMIMLLQTRGRMSARELAAELEVSERTVCRDVEALSADGIPIYCEPGRDGGLALLDSYRTSLTGLSAGEARALFMLSIPACLDELGVAGHLRSALLKLAASLPATRRGDDQRVRQCFYLDSTWWHEGQDALPHLRAIYQSLWEDRRLQVSNAIGELGLRLDQAVDPYGLVAKAGVWHLVYAQLGRLGVKRVSDLLDAIPLESRFERPAGFDLVASWTDWCARREARASGFPFPCGCRRHCWNASRVRSAAGLAPP
jgi:predicted DNA-binding transcriptional regulator YafY